MAVPLLVAAFVMNTASHILHGASLWLARLNSTFLICGLISRENRKRDLSYHFFADIVGLYSDFNCSCQKHAEIGLPIPSNDPSVILPALA